MNLCWSLLNGNIARGETPFSMEAVEKLVRHSVPPPPQKDVVIEFTQFMKQNVRSLEWDYQAYKSYLNI